MRIYAIDDEPKMLRMLSDAIREAEPEAELLSFSSAADALAAAEEAPRAPDVVFSDIELPGMDGLTLAARLKKLVPRARIVFVTGYDRYTLEAYRLHVGGYVMKPVDAAAIREELAELPRAPEPAKESLYVRCFGAFEVFFQGRPLHFERHRTRELLAFLVDRRGASCTPEEIAAALWESETDMRKLKHWIRNLVNDLRSTLREIGREELLIRRSGVLAIDAERLDCDYYRMLRGDMDAVNSYAGEYMTQYSWAELTAGRLWFSSKN